MQIFASEAAIGGRAQQKGAGKAFAVPSCTGAMVRAFVMVKTGAGESEATVEAIREIDAVVEAHVVAGEFDVIAEVDAPEVYDVLHTASSSIQGLDGVVDTKTYFALDD